MTFDGRLPRRLPERRAAVFDVTGWLADLSRLHADQVRYVEERERGGVLTVSYECGGDAVSVRVLPMSGVASAAWELVADILGRQERIVLPGGTRFLWRAPRGTHA